ncbi:alpha/beta fold hydrolase [Liquorilactobacillus satsumensis]|uniref:alpha/beta fold hydrolase n=2 Tax=Liquorilactobacillus satsumensis TaxID=259059 RepID=UPI0021C35A65|nr:alpha/beta hydrolase [Liquorilactobacillus satsumensis]MCP9327606.1 alpha/beta hydrolase [Liquorilactobacillus satsumensis]
MYKKYLTNEQFNFQINRFLEPYYTDDNVQQTIKENAEKLVNEESWYRVWNQLGLKTEKKGRNDLAAAYYQLADFFLAEEGIRKEQTYAAFQRTFYTSIAQVQIKFETVPYAGMLLPIARFSHPGATKTLIFHGGFDSYLEEIIRLTLTSGLLQLKDYNIILFEGPGQGRVLKDGFPMTHAWEKPIKAILDYYQIDAAVLLGMSLGGYLAVRAAAFEPRIKKVIAFDVYYSMLDSFTMKLSPQARTALTKIANPAIASKIDAALTEAAKSNIDLAFKIRKGNEVMQTHNASELIKAAQQYTLKGCGKKVTQDVLLLAGNQDLYVPTSTIALVAKKLVNAKSVTQFLFTEKSGGERHCQVGNKQIAFEKIISFLEK